MHYSPDEVLEAAPDKLVLIRPVRKASTTRAAAATKETH